MKKLIVLVSALLLVSMVAVASDVTLSGEVEQRYMQDLNNKAYTEGPVVEVKLDAVVDDNASLYIELEEGDTNIGIFDKAHFTLDLGGIFDLPVGVTLRTGVDEYDTFDATKITFGEYEDVLDSEKVTWGHEVNVAINDMVAVRAMLANDPGEEFYFAGIAVTYDPVYVEVSYVNNDETLLIVEDSAKGDILAGATFGMEVSDGIMVDASANLKYDIENSLTGDSLWMLGAAAKLTYNDMASLAVAFRGMTDSEANSMQVDVTAAPVEGIELFLVAGLGLDGDVYAETFDSFEGSVMYMLGPSTWYTGVMWIADGGAGIASEKSDFGPEDSDTMALFVRAELKY
jgi:hypothetical protein